jgi:hypothetical protein
MVRLVVLYVSTMERIRVGPPVDAADTAEMHWQF